MTTGTNCLSGVKEALWSTDRMNKGKAEEELHMARDQIYNLSNVNEPLAQIIR